ncbi:MAG: phosphoglucosamine mutase, partial [Candidatus Binatia bacterium]|nr:phosphoglucosamine mutase [Candidatus Binatia bacterium]
MTNNERQRGRLFGTDGIRGVANVEPMTSETALRLGRALAYVFRDRPGPHKILIGKDTRLSGYMLETALASGICSMGVNVLLVGPVPTPGIAFLTRSLRADAGVVISASHNPFQDNGVKIFSRDGFKLPDEVEDEIESLVVDQKIDHLRPTATAIGKAFRVDDALGRYNVFVKGAFPRDLTLDGVKIVVDCAHGAAYKVAPEVLEELGARVIAIGVEPDGENINRDCGALYPQQVQRLVRETGAHIGLALDGDADRAILVDETGALVDGDTILAIAAEEMLQHGTLRHATLVGTVMSNLGLEIAVRKMGGRLVRTAVGDRYVVEEMLRGDYNLGGEQSGHIVFL